MEQLKHTRVVDLSLCSPNCSPTAEEFIDEIKRVWDNGNIEASESADGIPPYHIIRRLNALYKELNRIYFNQR